MCLVDSSVKRLEVRTQISEMSILSPQEKPRMERRKAKLGQNLTVLGWQMITLGVGGGVSCGGRGRIDWQPGGWWSQCHWDCWRKRWFGEGVKGSLELTECKAPERLLQGHLGNLIIGCQGLQSRCGRLSPWPTPRVCFQELIGLRTLALGQDAKTA